MRSVAAVVFIVGLFFGLAFAFPPTPTPLANDAEWSHFDVQVHNRDNLSGWGQTMQAQHGADCSAPPATHPVSSFNNSVFVCNGHVMTAANSDGYGVIYITPSQILTIPGTVDFDLSTEKMSVRDWWDVSVSPFLDAQALPLLSDLSQGVDLQGPNRNSIVIATDNGEGAPDLKVVRNGTVTSYGGSAPANAGIAAGTNQAATRQPFRLTLTATSVRFERLPSATGPGVVFVNKTIPALTWNQGVVQFGHHSYSPTKDGAGVPATWHWSDFSLNPSVPFTLIHASPSRVTNTATVAFASPAPAGSYLRFAGACKVRVDGVVATKQVFTGAVEHASSYMVPIAAGKTSVNISFVADSWYAPGVGVGCYAEGFAVWSNAGGAPLTPSPTSTSTPVVPTATPTMTVTAPTATATRTPSPTPTSSVVPPTPSPVPTASSSPTLTSTPTPSHTYQCLDNGVVVWTQTAPGRVCP